MTTSTKDLIDAINYMFQAKEEVYQTTGINKMSCRSLDEKMRELRRYGCNRCRDEYDRIERDYYYHDRYREINYQMPYLTSDTKEIKMATVITPVEEPKNIAVRLLVDKLKTEQAILSNTKTSLNSYKNYVKTYSEAKNKSEKNIKELSLALKKLGHKE